MSIGGLRDAGAIATMAQAGAQFRYALLWPCSRELLARWVMEMAGRLAIASGHALRDANVSDLPAIEFHILPLMMTSSTSQAHKWLGGQSLPLGALAIPFLPALVSIALQVFEGSAPTAIRSRSGRTLIASTPLLDLENHLSRLRGKIRFS